MTEQVHDITDLPKKKFNLSNKQKKIAAAAALALVAVAAYPTLIKPKLAEKFPVEIDDIVDAAKS